MDQRSPDQNPHPKPGLADFLPRRDKLFTRTPPAIFLAVLGLMGLGLALRQAVQVLGVNQAPVDGFLGAVMGLWSFAVVALLAKILRRPGSVIDDLRVLPGRLGYPAAAMSGMAAALILLPHSPQVAFGLLWAALAAQTILALLLARTLWRLPGEAWMISPVWHFGFTGFVLAVTPLAQLGWSATAQVMLMGLLPIAALILATGLLQILRGRPSAPLRPLLALHLMPFALFGQAAGMTGADNLAMLLAVVGLVLFAALILTIPWLTQSGFGPLWLCFAYPLTAFAQSLLLSGAPWSTGGLALTGLALAIVPVLAWKMLRLWPGGKLAAKTNASIA